MGKKRCEFYAVRRGVVPGIYRTWEECKAQVTGFPGNEYHGFKTFAEAEAYLRPAQEASLDSSLCGSQQQPCRNNVSAAALLYQAEAPKVRDENMASMSTPSRTPRITIANHSEQASRQQRRSPDNLHVAALDCNAELQRLPGTQVEVGDHGGRIADHVVLAGCDQIASISSSPWLPSHEMHSCHAEALDELSDEQMVVARAVLAGGNVFCTGLPGSGKSFLLERIVQALSAQASVGEVVVCASTGAASVHVGGSTFHAFLNCGKGDTDKDWDRVLSDRRTRKRIKSAKILVLDEVSMFSGEFFQAASNALSSVRQDARPFGGLQVILCGDFLQLPPVKAKTMAFESHVWGELRLRNFVLQKNHRQSDDVEFQEVLKKLRAGQIPAELRASAVKPVVAPIMRTEGLDADGLLRTYGIGFKLLKKMGYQVPADGSHALVEGLRVGPPRVPEFLGIQDSDPQGAGSLPWPLPACSTRLVCTNAEADGENDRQLSELPGCVRTFLAVDGGDHLEDPSIQRALKDLVVPQMLNLKIGARVMLLKNIRLPSKCKEKHTGERQVPLVNGSIGVVLGFDELGPIVEFSNGYRRCVKPEDFSGQVGSSGFFCRKQVPLRLAWAITVHKCQGVTLDNGTVNLANIFDTAQMYVAMSRFRHLQDVQITGLPSDDHLRKMLFKETSCSSMRAKAIRFHDELESHTAKAA